MTVALPTATCVPTGRLVTAPRIFSVVSPAAAATTSGVFTVGVPISVITRDSRLLPPLPVSTLMVPPTW